MCLAGYPAWMFTDPTTRKTPPTADLSCIKTPENTQIITNFVEALFMIKVSEFFIGKKLRPVIEIYFATLLKYYEEVKKDHGANHMVIKGIERVAKDFSISNFMLKEWGDAINTDMKIRGIKLPENNIDNQLLIELLTAASTQSKRDNLVLLKEFSLQRKEMADLKIKVTTMERLLQVSVSQNSPSNKRKRMVRTHV